MDFHDRLLTQERLHYHLKPVLQQITNMVYVYEWHSGPKHCISVQEASLQSLVRIQTVSHPAVLRSPIGLHTINACPSPSVKMLLNKPIMVPLPRCVQMRKKQDILASHMSHFMHSSHVKTVYS